MGTFDWFLMPLSFFNCRERVLPLKSAPTVQRKQNNLSSVPEWRRLWDNFAFVLPGP